jgi:RimJ/RimL family protein N-acetyltransferase
MNISTARLQLRLLEQDDWAFFLALHDEPCVIEKCFDRPSDTQIRSKFMQRLAPWHPTANKSLCLMIIEIKTGKKVGVTGLTTSSSNTPDVGYLLMPEFYGQGYATEALQAFLTWATTAFNIQQFTAVVTKGNVGSEKVLAKCGFKLVSVEPSAYEIGGVLFDDHHFLLTCTE